MAETRGMLGDTWAFTKAAGKGVWDTGTDIVEGVGDLAKSGYKIATDPKARESAWETTKQLAEKAGDYGTAVIDDPAKPYRDARDGTIAAYDRFNKSKELAAKEGKLSEFYGEITGGGAVEVGSILIPAAAVTKVGKLGKVANVADDLIPSKKAKSLLSGSAIKELDDNISPIQKCAVKGGVKNTAKNVKLKFDELKRHGHGPQRHEGDVTPKQLKERAIKGIDPMSGTTKDAVTGKTHKYSRNATKINSPEDYVKAESHIKNSKEFQQKIKLAEDSGKNMAVVKESKLKEIYGSDYSSKVAGKTRVGSAKNPQGIKDTIYTDESKMVGVYQKSTDGNWHLVTMYPDL